MNKTWGLLLLLVHTSVFAQQQWKVAHQEMIFKDPPFAECHASTLVELAPEHMMAAWFGGTQEGHKDVSIWLAEKQNGQWAAPRLAATGIINDTLRYPCWNPVLFQSKSKTLFLFYKIGPSPREWWGMVQTSIDNGKTWAPAQRLPDGILGPIKNKPIQLNDGSILAPSSTETNNKWSVHIERSVDDGHSWQKIAVDTTGFDVIQPSILQYSDGRLQMVCRSKQGAVVQTWSDDGGKAWSALSHISVPNPNSGIDAVTLRNGMQLLVYNPAQPGAHWQEGRARLHVALSKNGQNWKDIAVLEQGTNEEYSYPAVIQAADGKVHITYTWQRKNIKYIVLQAQ